jgi:hypothetical protein
MNKILSSATIVVTALAISSCSKEKIAAPKSVQEPNKVSQINVATTAASFRTVWAFDPWRWTCLPVPENCHPVDIVIRPRLELSQLFSIAARENNGDIRAYMKTNHSVLSTVIPEEWVSAGIAGTYDVRYHFSKDNNTHFLLFKTGDAIIMAFPIIEEA